MLTIRREQMAIFETSARKRFEDYLFEELHRFAPSHCRSLGPEDVHGVIRLGVSRAETHMFTRQ
jgi:hypothetical protein